MEDFALCDTLWEVVTHAYYEQNPSWEDEEPEFNNAVSAFASRLSLHWAAAYGIHEFESDVLSGGLSTFFFNQEGVLNEVLPRAFDLVGAPEFIEPFNQATAVFDSFASTLYNRDWEPESDEYDKEDRRFVQELVEPSRRLSALMDRRDPRTCVAAFIRRNLEWFRTEGTGGP